MAEKIGFIGLGIMGAPMAKNLIKSGYEVTAYDIVASNLDKVASDGATKATSAKEVAEKSDITIIMVQNSPQSESAVISSEGALSGASPGDLIIDMSSISPLVSQKISAAC